MKCLLLGGAGFIGKNTALWLLKKGHEVTVYDIKVAGIYSDEELEKINYFERNLFDDEHIEEAISGQDVVLHFVSTVNPGTSMTDPSKGYKNDLARTVEILEIMKNLSVNKMLFISSGGTVYGNKYSDNFTEDINSYPVNHYGIIKLTIDKILHMYNELYGMHNVSLRVANPYGTGQQSTKGIGAVTTFAERIVSGDTIEIWGDGSVVRDYIYIDDVIGMIEEFVRFDSDKDNDIFNIGTGVGTSLNELIALLEKNFDKKANVKYYDSRSIDAPRNVLNMEKTFKAIGNKVNYSLEEGIKKYMEIKGYK